MSSPTLVTIGGGGFLVADTRRLQERYLLTHLRPTPDRRPRVVFLGTALGDSERGQLAFLKTFTALGCEASALTFFPYEMRRGYRDAVVDADLVYVGGGNTVAMIVVWREFGFERALREAYEGGTVLAGVSAGANCWFDRYVTDSVPGGGAREGLGFVPGTFCPHLDSEPWRHELLARSDAPAYGAGENVLLRFEGAALREAVHDTPPHLAARPAACRVREPGDAALRDVAPTLLTDAP